jgi:hypothetical protein
LNRLRCYWVQRPDEEDPDDQERSIHFRLTEDWVATDSDQLILPITLLARNGDDLDEPPTGLLKQYGGEGLLNDLLMDGQEVEAGSEWVISYDEGYGFNIYGVPSTDDG